MPSAKEIRSGSVVAMARLIREVDDGAPQAEKTLRELFKDSGKSQILGVTGLAGSGKSTLISLLITHFRKLGKKVGVVSVDPTSPFSGGAILGDRIRMNEHNTDPEVFIKSLATRGAFGGLSKSVVDIVHVMEAAGKDVIIIETVGVGQDEVDIFKIVQQVMLVLAPGLGDDIQAIKAGILEIADIFVVNKSDLQGAERTALEIKEAAEDSASGRTKAVLLTDAIHEKGLAELFAEIDRGLAGFADKKEQTAYLTRRYRYEIQLKVRDHLMQLVQEAFEDNKDFAAILKRVKDKKIDPYTAVEEILQHFSID